MPPESFSDKHQERQESNSNAAERIGANDTLNLPTLYAQNRNNLNNYQQFSTNSPAAQAYESTQASVVHIKTIDSMASPSVANVTLGTGFFATADGVVVTDYHVVQNGKLGMTVQTSDGQVHQAQVIGVDKAHDLALLQVTPNSPAEHFQAVQLGSSNALRSNESLTALGFPDNVLHVSPGSFSKYTKLSQYDLSQNGGLMPGEDPNRPVLQTNNPTHPGDSGGPLLTPDGKVAGVLDLSGDTSSFTVSTPVEYVKQLLARDGINIANPGLSAQNNFGYYPAKNYYEQQPPAQAAVGSRPFSFNDLSFGNNYGQPGDAMPMQVRQPSSAQQNALQILKTFANLPTIPGLDR